MRIVLYFAEKESGSCNSLWSHLPCSLKLTKYFLLTINESQQSHQVPTASTIRGCFEGPLACDKGCHEWLLMPCPSFPRSGYPLTALIDHSLWSQH